MNLAVLSITVVKPGAFVLDISEITSERVLFFLCATIADCIFRTFDLKHLLRIFTFKRMGTLKKYESL